MSNEEKARDAEVRLGLECDPDELRMLEFLSPTRGVSRIPDEERCPWWDDRILDMWLWEVPRLVRCVRGRYYLTRAGQRRLRELRAAAKAA